MGSRRLFIAMTAGAALTVSGCGGKSPPEAPESPTAPQEPSVPEVQPVPPPALAVDPSLPTWDGVRSNHPEGATNPPRSVLIVTPEGTCFKDFAGGSLAPTPETSDRVQDCSGDVDCGTPVQCPPRAAQLLAHHQAGKKPRE